MISKIFNWCRNHIVRTNLIVIVVELVIMALAWYFAGGKQTFQTVSNYTFLCVSVLIASVAALNSIIASLTAHDSMLLTSNSLELTRNTLRPFLDVSECVIHWSATDDQRPTSVNFITTDIENSGVFPADKVSLEVEICKPDDENEKRSCKLKHENTSIIFPNENASNYRFEEIDKEHKLPIELNDGQLQIQVTIGYLNKLTQIQHKTVRLYVAKYPINGTNPLSTGNYWE